MWLRKLFVLSLGLSMAACGEPKLPSPFKVSDVTSK